MSSTDDLSDVVVPTDGPLLGWAVRKPPWGPRVKWHPIYDEPFVPKTLPESYQPEDAAPQMPLPPLHHHPQQQQPQQPQQHPPMGMEGYQRGGVVGFTPGLGGMGGMGGVVGVGGGMIMPPGFMPSAWGGGKGVPMGGGLMPGHGKGMGPMGMGAKGLGGKGAGGKGMGGGGRGGGRGAPQMMMGNSLPSS